MKLKLDENLPRSAVELLSSHGHDALAVHDQLPPGTADSRIAEVIRQEGRALVTLDLDFADIRTYDPKDYPGIIVLRPRPADAVTVLSTLRRLLELLGTEPLEGRLWIVEERRVRVRGAAG